MTSEPRFRRSLTLLALFAALLTLRIWGVSNRFWLLEDQIRDWGIALGPFSDLPLLGPPTHVHGYTIGPAFYWILWTIRVTVGPWFDYLPHGGGIGEAILHSAADVLLCVAVWRRTGSAAAAIATSVLLASAAYDLCFAALVWNPPMGTTLAKAAVALVLLGWHRQSTWRAVVVFSLAWAAVQAYTGAAFVMLAVFLAALVDPLVRRARLVPPGSDPAVVPGTCLAPVAETDERVEIFDRSPAMAMRNAGLIAGVMIALQVPYLIYAARTAFGQPVMGAVTGSITDVITGGGKTQFAASATKYAEAVAFIQAGPWTAPWMAWLLMAATIVVVIRYWRDPALILLLAIPGVTAILGYGLFQGALDFYYYLSLIPAAVLTIVFALMALPWPKARAAIGIVILVAAIAVVPARVKYSATFHQLPQYQAIVAGSRIVAQRGTPMRAIRTEFALPPTCDPGFVYRILGGTIDKTSPWIALIAADGSVSYQAVESS